MNISIPNLSLVVLIGPSGAGKSTFARKHFKPTEVLSSDSCRGLVCDDENDQTVSNEAFHVLHTIAGQRLALGKLTVVDATNVQPESRAPLVALARQYHCLPVAIVFKLQDDVCHERNHDRSDRAFGPHVVRQQNAQLRRSLRGLQREGFRHVFVLDSPEAVDAAVIERTPLWNDRRHDSGPFDIIGDVHGCSDELLTLLAKLGYAVESNDGEFRVTPPAGRKAIFLGDLGDRGPRILDSFRLVMSMVKAETALCVPGNHDIKLMRWLRGKNVQITHGLEKTIAEIESLDPSKLAVARNALGEFIDGLVSHYVLDGGRLVVAHAGLKEEMQGRGSGKVREFALYGETTGETDEFGLPIRYPWAANYRGRATVVYGHTPVPEPEWLNHTINIDTGCVFGGALTALRWPERELVSVRAAATYCEPARPFLSPEAAAPTLTAQQAQDDMLDLSDVTGKRIISTRLHRNITIRAENAAAALEVMSRFAVNPKWLIYLPPTMSPSGTSREPGLLEHPAEAFAYFRHEGVPRVICEEKHMGSRAVVVICRDEDVARKRFGITDDGAGICYTRTGRRFFDDAALECAMLERIRSAATTSGLWNELITDWLCLDCELMPWSAKAQALLREQYASVGAAARASLAEAMRVLDETVLRQPDAAVLRDLIHGRHAMSEQFVAAYRRYCWPVTSLEDFKLAPFHLLASEGAVHAGKDHVWHMETLARLCGADTGLLLATPYLLVDVTDATSEAAGAVWWEALTARGGEGMVIKPLDFIARNRGELIQPAVKCRGREYLRIIYGPEYTREEHLDRLRSRGLGLKRSLAAREFALGVESLERFVRREPLRRVHECAFAVLAMESQPVDPRL